MTSMTVLLVGMKASYFAVRSFAWSRGKTISYKRARSVSRGSLRHYWSGGYSRSCGVSRAGGINGARVGSRSSMNGIDIMRSW